MEDLEIADTYERMFSLSGMINQSKGDRHFSGFFNGVNKEKKNEKKAKRNKRPSAES